MHRAHRTIYLLFDFFPPCFDPLLPSLLARFSSSTFPPFGIPPFPTFPAPPFAFCCFFPLPWTLPAAPLPLPFECPLCCTLSSSTCCLHLPPRPGASTPLPAAPGASVPSSAPSCSSSSSSSLPGPSYTAHISSPHISHLKQ